MVRTGHKSPYWPHPVGVFTGLGAAQKEVQADSVCAPSGAATWTMKSGPKRWHALDFGDMERRGCGVDQTQQLVTVRARHDTHLVHSSRLIELVAGIKPFNWMEPKTPM